MATYGITDQGVVIKTLDIIEEELITAYKATFGDQINLLPASVFSQLIRIPAEREALIWELYEMLYYSQYPNAAQGISLDYAVSINGLVRKPATYSLSMEQIFRSSVANVLIPAGTRVVNIENSDIVYSTIADVTTGQDQTIDNSGKEIQEIQFTPAAASGTWVLGLGTQFIGFIAWNAPAATVKTIIEGFTGITTVTVVKNVSGIYTVGYTVTFDVPVVPSTTTLGQLAVNTDLLLDTASKPVYNQTITKQFGGNSAKSVAQALNIGSAYYGNYDTLTSLQSPIANVTATANVLAATLARNQETDAELRIRRTQELAVSGTASADAIRSDILALNNVQYCLVAVNNSMVVQGTRPPKSFEAFVSAYDKSDLSPITGPNTSLIQALRQDIAKIILADGAAGIESYGTISEIVYDSMNIAQTVRFSQPTPVPIFAIFTVQINPNKFPSNGVSLCTQAILAYGASLGTGQTVVVYPDLISSLKSIPGILDIDTKIGRTGSPTTDASIPIAAGTVAPTYLVEISTWDSGNIAVTTTTSAV